MSLVRVAMDSTLGQLVPVFFLSVVFGGITYAANTVLVKDRNTLKGNNKSILQKNKNPDKNNEMRDWA